MSTETAREKAKAGKEEAEADLGVRLSGNDFARSQSVTWHRKKDGTTPPYEYREIGGRDVQDNEGVAIPGKRGRLVATPSRLLKLLVPLRPMNSDPSSMSADEPLALLIHPHQPLSYLERLIQAEIAPIEAPGVTRPPDITFLAHDPTKLDSHPDHPKRKNELVRWSAATEVGDFVRDASKGQEFVIVIEGRGELSVRVPSFEDRTYFLRQKLRGVSVEIDRLSRLKQECDTLAHKSAQNLAVGGFACLTSWWAAVWYLTFHTSLGWDVMEPVTYLAGLTSIMLGYLWFLYHNREVSYRSVLHLTVSKRQIKLYAQKGFDLDHWQDLLDEGKSLRKEIRGVADQYDVDWDESKDRVGERVKKALDGKKDKKDDEDREDRDD
ncbi:Similar to Calcium uniporter protein, mitochondrial; acc. no. Q3UMR5 [Pyronema omphalodes CBS 100304]|uniref:Calcium uniporter protein n=1 Tax=Pyronema omphalodes (strain CBS 100304) TaxID=1076935 RepID=U4LFM6_PYROM|nr:Similar to Calcium uniporter protein, mitochondrial; acc. no. Q3UMR5 [Pyronema omphalodes CBS 100304]